MAIARFMGFTLYPCLHFIYCTFKVRKGKKGQTMCCTILPFILSLVSNSFTLYVMARTVSLQAGVKEYVATGRVTPNLITDNAPSLISKSSVNGEMYCKFQRYYILDFDTGCPNKHRNSVTNSRSSRLRINIVKPDFKSHNISMSDRVYIIKSVNDCKDVSIMALQDEQ